MIQRIQSLWLALAALCMVLGFMFPVAQYHLDMPTTGQKAEARLDLVAKDNPQMYNQISNVEPVVDYSQKGSGFHSWPLMALALAVCAITLAAIFLFRNRPLQMGVVATGFLLTVVYVFLLFFWAVDSYGKTVAQALGGSGLEITWQVGAYAPLATIVLLILAHRGIKSDEAKVRAADRLR